MTSAHTTFSKETFEAFRSNNRAGPVQLLNLIKLRDKAVYADGQQRSGREAYASYGTISAPVLAAAGGRIVWRGNWELCMIGPSSEQWDVCFIAEYPSAAAFADMLKNPVYREAMVHRLAAVEDSRLIRFASAPAGSMFHGS
ncbi:DUF1330 domain-containing protein [uncultured Bradyrhizobium sp.]|uniref:DUF1330 domain-containing protein n=1 Tax=uncultured Bradyrhizobium sp. TaxID=199684 RepID=UPI0035CBB13E